MPKLREQIRDLHKVPFKYAGKPFNELAVYLHRCIDMEKDWSPEFLMKCLEEHHEYAASQLAEFGYTQLRRRING